MRKQYEQGEDQCQKLEVEVSILKGKLVEKDKHLEFHNSTNISDLIFKDIPRSNILLVSMKLLKENLAHKFMQAILCITKKNMRILANN